MSSLSLSATARIYTSRPESVRCPPDRIETIIIFRNYISIDFYHRYVQFYELKLNFNRIKIS